jgi:hypothetical protein
MIRRSATKTIKNGNSSKPKQVRYKISLVTYLDILGFRGLLQVKTAGEISRILRIFKTAARRDEATEADFDRLYEHFSDLTIRSVNVSSADYLRVRPALLLYELESIARIQIELLRHHSILIRGGIAIGPLVKSWGLVYGEGMVNAYILETQAKHPRVMIQQELGKVLEQLAEDERWSLVFANVTALDRDRRFVDYLGYAPRYFEEPDDLLDFVARHKAVIEDGLSRFAFDPEINAKFKWLKRYHNSTIRQTPFPAMFEDFSIN